MRSVWETLAKDSRFEHVFFVGCDSHALQLYVKDIFGPDGIAYYRDTLNQATTLSQLLRRNKKTWALVKEVALAAGLATKNLTFAAVTRWGSHFAVVDALIANRRILRDATKDSRLFCYSNGSYAKGGQEAKTLINTYEF